MQSALTEPSPNATISAIRNQPQSLQHGLSSIQEQFSNSLLSGDGVGESNETATDIETASASSTGGARGRQCDAKRVNRKDSSQESSPGSRIDEYERAHATIRKPSDGVIFQVIPSAKAGQGSVSIEDFPNEVLTHILSHLTPDTLSSMSLVSRRFYKLVTTPPPWRIAFARFFPGVESTSSVPSSAIRDYVAEIEPSQRRAFTRLSALSTWRSEYILRTRLLRSLARGKPALQTISKSSSARYGGAGPGTAVITYQSGLMFPVSHLHATFGVGLNKKQPLVIHGAAEQGLVSSSDPTVGKIASWGLGDFQAFKHFADLFPGEREYGLAPAKVVGMPNVLDVSQPYGKIYGESCPGGRVFYTASDEQRGRFLQITSSPSHTLGIPQVTMQGSAVCSVWIAKSEAPLKISDGLFGSMAGFSNGVLAAYALGTSPVYDKRFDKGEPTAKWVLCPGVPIIAINVDDKVSRRRVDAGRVWLVVLNALGEVFYLTGNPARPEHRGKASPDLTDRLAWQTGRSVEWHLIERTRRVAKGDPFGTATVDGSYSPRSSAKVVGLSHDQLAAETKEIERFMLHSPDHYQSICDGWDMRRKLIVDFAGDDHHGAGESVIILNCGLEEGQTASIQRLTRTQKKISVDHDLDSWPAIQPAQVPSSVLRSSSPDPPATQSPGSLPRSRTSSTDEFATRVEVEWLTTTFGFGDLRQPQISAVAIDESELAMLRTTEDPLLGMSGCSNSSSPTSSPIAQNASLSSRIDVPGHRARLMATGTQNGLVFLWDTRGPLAFAADVINTVQPVRIIYTRSPQISSLALTSLYLVHGGNDGLVQAWDPLGSSSEPIRTLNSRFSDRARRRIAQADASAQGVGHNYFAAGAIILDPDPTVLRGMVSLGTHLRYWSYSATAADAYKTKKRGQLRRRSERGSNTAVDHKVTATGRGVLKDYIVNEQLEMEREKHVRAKESERMSGRFGINLLGHGASDDDMLAYATMLSQEAHASNESKRKSSPSPRPASKTRRQEVADADLEEAIRLSLLESEQASPQQSAADYDIPIRYGRGFKRSTKQFHTKTASGAGGEPTSSQEDLEFAMQLSLAEHQSKADNVHTFLPVDNAPSSGSEDGSSEKGKGKGKGKGKAQARRH